MQTTDTVLMIEPIAFGFNEQTAVNNYFQVQQEGNVQEKALEEFHSFVEKLRAKGINVLTIKDTIDPKTPDSIFLLASNQSFFILIKLPEKKDFRFIILM